MQKTYFLWAIIGKTKDKKNAALKTDLAIFWTRREANEHLGDDNFYKNCEVRKLKVTILPKK